MTAPNGQFRRPQSNALRRTNASKEIHNRVLHRDHCNMCGIVIPYYVTQFAGVPNVYARRYYLCAACCGAKFNFEDRGFE